MLQLINFIFKILASILAFIMLLLELLIWVLLGVNYLKAEDYPNVTKVFDDIWKIQ